MIQSVLVFCLGLSQRCRPALIVAGQSEQQSGSKFRICQISQLRVQKERRSCAFRKSSERNGGPAQTRCFYAEQSADIFLEGSGSKSKAKGCRIKRAERLLRR